MFSISRHSLCLIQYGTNNAYKLLVYKQSAKFSNDKVDPIKNRKWFSMPRLALIPVSFGLLQWKFIQKSKKEAELKKAAAQDETSNNLASEWEVSVYTLLPLRFVSRIWGTLTNINLPVFLRAKVYNFYAKSFGVDLTECQIEDLTHYRNLSEFFIRPLKRECRPIDQDPNSIVSPADGKILSFGKITTCQVEQVKGVTYSLPHFLGDQTWFEANDQIKIQYQYSLGRRITIKSLQTDEKTLMTYAGSALEQFLLVGHQNTKMKRLKEELKDEKEEEEDSGRKLVIMNPDSDESEGDRSMAMFNNNDYDKNDEDRIAGELRAMDEQYLKNLKKSEKSDLYQLIVYLAPGDYHRFHSPTNWTVVFRRHFQGKLLSVNPAIASWIRDLFTLNERAMYVGSWKYGFFSMTAVGATNVGSIKVPFDTTLHTNRWDTRPRYRDCYFDNNQNARVASGVKGIHMTKGQLFGEFRLGSTVVLVFEAPKNFKFDVQSGQRIKYGEKIGTVIEPEQSTDNDE